MKHLIVFSVLAAIVIGTPALANERVSADPRLQQTEVNESATVEQNQRSVSSMRILDARRSLSEQVKSGQLSYEHLNKLSRGELSIDNAALRGSHHSQPRSVTVLAAYNDVNAVVNEFGLSVLYVDANTGLAVLDIGEHDDVLELVQTLKASTLVRAVRVSRSERRFELGG